MMAIAFSVLSVSAQNEEKLVVNAGNTEQISIANYFLNQDDQPVFLTGFR